MILKRQSYIRENVCASLLCFDRLLESDAVEVRGGRLRLEGLLAQSNRKIGRQESP